MQATSPANQPRTGFKRRQNTAVLSIWLIFVGLILFAIGCYLLSLESFFTAAFQILVGIMLISFAASMLWCEVEDIGHALSVKFGPLTGFMCGTAEAVIPYNQIKTYREPRDSWEGCCAYGVGKVNTCVGVRQHSMCSCDCKQRQLVIEYNTAQKLYCKPYDKITIAVNGRDWQSLLKLLEEKYPRNAAGGTATI